MQIPDNTALILTPNKPKKPGPSTKNPLTELHWAQAHMETIQELFKYGQDMNKINSLERRVLFADDISKVSLENIKRISWNIWQNVPQSQQANLTSATAAAHSLSQGDEQRHKITKVLLFQQRSIGFYLMSLL